MIKEQFDIYIATLTRIRDEHQTMRSEYYNDPISLAHYDGKMDMLTAVINDLKVIRDGGLI